MLQTRLVLPTPPLPLVIEKIRMEPVPVGRFAILRRVAAWSFAKSITPRFPGVSEISLH
jgi:hypothetical protein